MSEKKEEAKKEIRATVLAKTAQAIAKYAEKGDLGVGEAIDKLIGTAVSRLAALDRYAKNSKAEKKPREKKPRAKKPAAAKKKKASPKATSKANGAAEQASAEA